MGASVTPPEALEEISHSLAHQPRVELRGGWVWHDTKEWSLLIAARLAVEPSAYVGAETLWHLVLRPEGRSADVKFFPDKDGGMTATFAHQTHNGAGNAKSPWRSGHPCLDLPIARLGRVAWNDEPGELFARVRWHLDRLLRWLDAAAGDQLVQPGDPFELPDLRDRLSEGVIGFREATNSLNPISADEPQWGYANLVSVPGALKTWALVQRLDQAGKVLEDFEWSLPIAEAREVSPAVWIRLAGLPVLTPWRRPETWAELNEILAAQSIDFASILSAAGIRYRKLGKRRKPFRILLCFPVPERVGESPARLHWLVIAKVSLTDSHAKRSGFRSNETNYRRWDSQIALSTGELRWQRTMNWAPDQLRTRGEAESDVRAQRVLMIGAGSLGAAIAASLVRLGVTHMLVLDAQRFEVGNLSRHVLTLGDAGHNKAIALARQLNLSMPDAKVEGKACDFPPADEKTCSLVNACSVVIDCSGSDAVLDAMASYEWNSEKIFVSLSMAWRAEGLLAFTASEASFPAIDARTRFNAAPAPSVDFNEARMEGIGCWLPVFPASVDDVQLWAAIGCKFIRQAVAARERRFTYFRQSGKGEVQSVET